MTMPADAPRVGVLGCGNMGSAIARRLVGVGRRVSAWNRTVSRANALIGLGVDVAPTVQALTDEADVVLAVVSSQDDIRSALSGVEFKAVELGLAGHAIQAAMLREQNDNSQA